MSAYERHLPALLRWLTYCAEHGEPCPAGTTIAERFGLSSRSGGHRLLGLLEATGAVRSTVFRRGVRIVTITATGRATAFPTSLKPSRNWREQPTGAPA